MSDVLSIDELYGTAIDFEEQEEITRSLLLPDGRYYTSPPLTVTTKNVKIKVEDSPHPEVEGGMEIERPITRFFGRGVNEEGVGGSISFRISHKPIYQDGRDGPFYLKASPGRKPDGPTKNFHQLFDLYKLVQAEKPSSVGELIEWVRTNALSVRVITIEGREGPMNVVVGFNAVF